MVGNGAEVVTITTRHGQFTLRRPRLRDGHGQEVHLPCPRISEPLRRQALFWVNRLSFGDVTRLLAEMAGVPVLSEDSLWRLAQREAQAIDAQQLQAIRDVALLPEPEYATPAVLDADLYDAAAVEFVVMTDGIGVKAQKPTRERAGEVKRVKAQKRHDTDVLILPLAGGGERVVCEGVSGHWGLVDASRANLRREWGGATLSVVALTDGAKTIRADLRALFGEGVRVVLDWYHLAKRVYQQLSMAAHSMREREGWEKQVLAWLWRGDVAGARAFLGALTGRSARALPQ